MDTQKYTVLTRCMTYNHAPYIVDAMNGFCIQETSFPVVSVIIDDASTDGEQEVIQKYVQENFNLQDNKVVRREETDDYKLVFAQHNTNKNCFFAVIFLKYNHYGKKEKRPYYAEWLDAAKYVAYCEGDDYWTDPHKLQKQVDFMDSHPEYGFCCHRFKIFEQDEQTFRQEYGHTYYKEGENLEITKELYLRVWVTQMLTTMFRQNLYNIAINACREKYHSVRDTYLYYEFLHLGKGISLNHNMGVYRWHQGGIAIGQDGYTRYKTGVKIYTNLYKNHPEDAILLPKIRYNYERLLRYATFTKEGFTFLKDSFLYCKTYSQKIRMVLMFIIPPSLFVMPNKIYRNYLRQKCSTSNPL